MKNSNKVCLFEVDIENPKHLHKAHEDLPFLPERRKPLHKPYKLEVSDVVKKAHNKPFKQFNITHEPKNKLIATMQDKVKYAVNISTLKQPLDHGLILTEVHRVIQYNQSNWLKPYVDKNTKLRANEKNEFEKNFFKLMNNAVFGKMIENVRKRRGIKLIATKQRRKKLTSEPNYESCKAFSDHLIAIEMRKTSVLMDKLVMVGKAILDKSKILIYEFYYYYLKPKYKGKVKLLYMDTDSFVLHVETEDVFGDIKNDIHDWFDTSKNLKSLYLPLEYGVNKKIIEKMTDELFNGFMKEFIAIGPKIYEFTQLKYDESINETKKIKGTNKCVTDKTLNFDLLKTCLFNNKTIRCIQHRIRYKPGLMNSIEINKIALKNKDDQRLKAFDGITTYPAGASAFKVCKSEMEITTKIGLI